MERVSRVQIAVAVAAPVSGNEWSAPGADISPSQGQLLPLHVGATVGCDHWSDGTYDDKYFADENRYWV